MSDTPNFLTEETVEQSSVLPGSGSEVHAAPAKPRQSKRQVHSQKRAAKYREEKAARESHPDTPEASEPSAGESASTHKERPKKVKTSYHGRNSADKYKLGGSGTYFSGDVRVYQKLFDAAPKYTGQQWRDYSPLLHEYPHMLPVKRAAAPSTELAALVGRGSQVVTDYLKIMAELPAPPPMLERAYQAERLFFTSLFLPYRSTITDSELLELLLANDFLGTRIITCAITGTSPDFSRSQYRPTAWSEQYQDVFKPHDGRAHFHFFRRKDYKALQERRAEDKDRKRRKDLILSGKMPPTDKDVVTYKLEELTGQNAPSLVQAELKKLFDSYGVPPGKMPYDKWYRQCIDEQLASERQMIANCSSEVVPVTPPPSELPPLVVDLDQSSGADITFESYQARTANTKSSAHKKRQKGSQIFSLIGSGAAIRPTVEGALLNAISVFISSLRFIKPPVDNTYCLPPALYSLPPNEQKVPHHVDEAIKAAESFPRMETFHVEGFKPKRLFKVFHALKFGPVPQMPSISPYVSDVKVRISSNRTRDPDMLAQSLGLPPGSVEVEDDRDARFIIATFKSLPLLFLDYKRKTPYTNYPVNTLTALGTVVNQKLASIVASSDKGDIPLELLRELTVDGYPKLVQKFHVEALGNPVSAGTVTGNLIRLGNCKLLSNEMRSKAEEFISPFSPYFGLHPAALEQNVVRIALQYDFYNPKFGASAGPAFNNRQRDFPIVMSELLEANRFYSTPSMHWLAYIVAAKPKVEAYTRLKTFTKSRLIFPPSAFTQIPLQLYLNSQHSRFYPGATGDLFQPVLLGVDPAQWFRTFYNSRLTASPGSQWYWVYSDNVYAYERDTDTFYSFDGKTMEAQINESVARVLLKFEEKPSFKLTWLSQLDISDAEAKAILATAASVPLSPEAPRVYPLCNNYFDEEQFGVELPSLLIGSNAEITTVSKTAPGTYVVEGSIKQRPVPQLWKDYVDTMIRTVGASQCVYGNRACDMGFLPSGSIMTSLLNTVFSYNAVRRSDRTVKLSEAVKGLKRGDVCPWFQGAVFTFESSCCLGSPETWESTNIDFLGYNLIRTRYGTLSLCLRDNTLYSAPLYHKRPAVKDRAKQQQRMVSTYMAYLAQGGVLDPDYAAVMLYMICREGKTLYDKDSDDLKDAFSLQIDDIPQENFWEVFLDRCVDRLTLEGDAVVITAQKNDLHDILKGYAMMDGGPAGVITLKFRSLLSALHDAGRTLDDTIRAICQPNMRGVISDTMESLSSYLADLFDSTSEHVSGLLKAAYL